MLFGIEESVVDRAGDVYGRNGGVFQGSLELFPVVDLCCAACARFRLGFGLLFFLFAFFGFCLCIAQRFGIGVEGGV